MAGLCATHSLLLTAATRRPQTPSHCLNGASVKLWQGRRKAQPCTPPAAAATSASAAPATASQQHAAPPAPAEAPLCFPGSYYDEQGKLVLKNLMLPELEAWCESIGEDGPRRGRQLWRFMYADRQWVRNFDDAAAERVQNGFSRGFLDKVAGLATLDAGLRLQSIHAAADGTRKMVFRLANGPAAGGQVEAVLIPVVREAGSKPRITLCISSQVGCAMNCQFCYTGRMGLMASLPPGQIVEQVVAARRLLFEEESAANAAAAAVVEGGESSLAATAALEGEDPSVAAAAAVGGGEEVAADAATRAPLHVTPITNIVYMGMGEPLHNLPAVLSSLATLCHPLGMHFSHNKVTVSTVGLIPEMRAFAAASRAAMAVSLHATTDEVRDWIVPVNRKEGLQALIGCMEELFPRSKAAPRHGHHVFIEYIMLRGVNDSDEDARRLVQLTRNIRCKLNLIVFNPHEGTSFYPSTTERVYAFRNILIQGGRVATVRDSRGDDQMAACGQLGSAEAGSSTRPPPPLLAPPERLREGLEAAAGLAA